ncbi:MAG: nucleotidyltransferase domain-containing protein [Desulfobacterales bacterium]|jgi:predicted nucleotidyltransferase|nr:nucleotidyltransferase domain-containing protein [Desulfobacterales bacterium]
MITEKEKKTIQEIAQKYDASRVLLFGSALSDTTESRDIDIAVEGIADRDFYAFYGELIFALPKPVDVVDLSKKTRFIEFILKEGVPLYA